MVANRSKDPAEERRASAACTRVGEDDAVREDGLRCCRWGEEWWDEGARTWRMKCKECGQVKNFDKL